jgi:hypothetical protein
MRQRRTWTTHGKGREVRIDMLVMSTMAMVRWGLECMHVCWTNSVLVPAWKMSTHDQPTISS